jgi:hypothetical protein
MSTCHFGPKGASTHSQKSFYKLNISLLTERSQTRIHAPDENRSWLLILDRHPLQLPADSSTPQPHRADFRPDCPFESCRL